MWKVVAFLVAVSLKSANSAVLDCNPQPGGECKVVSIDPITQANEVITILGKPSDYINPSIKKISFDGFTLNYVPTSLFTTFPNLETMEIFNSGTLTLTTDAFKNCKKLKHIAIQGATIKNVPAGIASNCAALISLALSKNNIATIDPNAFKGMSALGQLVLFANKLTCLPPTLFSNTKNIFYIDVSANKITALDSNILKNLPKLNFFYMNFNSLTYMPLLNLAGTPTSNSLSASFSDNPIKAFNPNFGTIFSDYPNKHEFRFQGSNCISNNDLPSFKTSNYNANLFSNCFANYDSKTMPETTSSCQVLVAPIIPAAPIIINTLKPYPIFPLTPPELTTIATFAPTTTVELTTTTLPKKICVSYTEWLNILRNYDFSQYSRRCPRFRRREVCFRRCLLMSGRDSNI